MNMSHVNQWRLEALRADSTVKIDAEELHEMCAALLAIADIVSNDFRGSTSSIGVAELAAAVKRRGDL